MLEQCEVANNRRKRSSQAAMLSWKSEGT